MSNVVTVYNQIGTFSNWPPATTVSTGMVQLANSITGSSNLAATPAMLETLSNSIYGVDYALSNWVASSVAALSNEIAAVALSNWLGSSYWTSSNATVGTYSNVQIQSACNSYPLQVGGTVAVRRLMVTRHV